MNRYDSLQLREIFHLEFLRRLNQKVNPSHYALKGGANLRFFYHSFRYSEDMDLDVRNIEVETLRDKVMQILTAPVLQINLRLFGIDQVRPPDMAKAKQTPTTQRFKVHLISAGGEDLFTKIEFSRRQFGENVKVESVSPAVLRAYKMAPLLVPHYGIVSVIQQKVDALAGRPETQARDVFDLYILSTQIEPSDREQVGLEAKKAKQARQNILDIGFEQFRDSVVAYLSLEDQKGYDSFRQWDEIKLKTIDFIKELET